MDINLADHKYYFRPHSFGSGKRRWFIVAYLVDDIVLPDGRKFNREIHLSNNAGNTIWYSSYENARRRADQYELKAKGLRKNPICGWNVIV